MMIYLEAGQNPSETCLSWRTVRDKSIGILSLRKLCIFSILFTAMFEHPERFSPTTKSFNML